MKYILGIVLFFCSIGDLFSQENPYFAPDKKNGTSSFIVIREYGQVGVIVTIKNVFTPLTVKQQSMGKGIRNYLPVTTLIPVVMVVMSTVPAPQAICSLMMKIT